MNEKTSTVQSATAPKTRKRRYKLKLYGDLVCRYNFYPERTLKTRTAYRLEAALYKGKTDKRNKDAVCGRPQTGK